MQFSDFSFYVPKATLSWVREHRDGEIKECLPAIPAQPARLRNHPQTTTPLPPQINLRPASRTHSRCQHQGRQQRMSPLMLRLPSRNKHPLTSDDEGEKSAKRVRCKGKGRLPQRRALKIVSTCIPAPDTPFNLIKSLCRADQMHSIMTQYVPPEDLLNLFCISKDFHFHVNSQYSSYVLSSTRQWARLVPESRQADSRADIVQGEARHYVPPAFKGRQAEDDIISIFPFSMYRGLCIRDPTRRADALEPRTPATATRLELTLPIPKEKDCLELLPEWARNPDVRNVPSLRYVFFAQHRMRTLNSIVDSMNEYYRQRLPRDASLLTLGKMWAVLDMPTNSARMALVRNKEYWTDRDIYLSALITFRVDMCMNDPVIKKANKKLREMLYSVRSFVTLAKFLRREAVTDQIEMIQLIVRYSYKPGADHKSSSMFGVPAHEIGMLQWEGWGRNWKFDGLGWIEIPKGAPDQGQSKTRPITKRKLFRPDQVILREAVRRGLNLARHAQELLMSGYVDPITLEELSPPMRNVAFEESDPRIERIMAARRLAKQSWSSIMKV